MLSMTKLYSNNLFDISMRFILIYYIYWNVNYAKVLWKQISFYVQNLLGFTKLFKGRLYNNSLLINFKYTHKRFIQSDNFLLV